MSSPNPLSGSTADIEFDAALLQKYAGRGPRYTSYPTALQFDPTFDGARYRTIAKESNSSGRALSVYAHIPFCDTLCYYCGCNKIVTRNAARVQRYMDCLYEEIRMQSELFDSDRVVSQLHLGGGTPTYLDDTQLATLLTTLSKNFTLDVSDAREFSIEIDPRSTHDETIEMLGALGFNRVSLGVQDFEPRVQKAVNRMQSAEEIETLTEQARSHGYRSVSFDLIYGLPHQSVASFDRTLDQVIDIRPDRLAIYNYAHLPERFKSQRMIAEKDLPSSEEKLSILRHTIQKLQAAGYVYIGMDHFALPDDELAIAKREGTLQRNFQGYSTHGGSDLVAMGVSAISRIGASFSQNALSTGEYEERLQSGRLPVRKGMLVDDDDQLRGRIIHDLMCFDRVDMTAASEAHSIDFASYFSDELAELTPLEADGLVLVTDDAIRVTPRGRLLLRNIAMVFDRHLGSHAETRFSKAI